MLHDDCAHCGQRYALDRDNSRIFEYTGDSYRMFSHLQAECPACTGVTRIYVVSEGLLEAKHAGLPLILEATAPSVIQAAYWKAMGYRKLTPHQERQVSFFVWLMDQGVYA